MIVAISVDTVEENAAMVSKLALPFPLLADLDASAIAGWEVYDPVGGTHGPIAKPAIFVVGRDLGVRYEYVGRDFADRPPTATLFGALDDARGAPAHPLTRSVATPGPRPPDAGNPADKAMPLEHLAPYFRGGSFAVQALAGRTDDPKLRAEAEAFRTIVAEFMKASIETYRMEAGR